MAKFFPLISLPTPLGKPATVTLAGSVTSSGAPVQRSVLVYRNNATAPEAEIVSAADGSFSSTLGGNANDKFRVLIIGIGDEYSKVFDRIQVS